MTTSNAFERIVGRVWPRHGHRGRPFNSVVRRHKPGSWQSGRHLLHERTTCSEEPAIAVL
jgi:hypothetical protein